MVWSRINRYWIFNYTVCRISFCKCNGVSVFICYRRISYTPTLHIIIPQNMSCVVKANFQSLVMSIFYIFFKFCVWIFLTVVYQIIIIWIYIYPCYSVFVTESTRIKSCHFIGCVFHIFESHLVLMSIPWTETEYRATAPAEFAVISFICVTICFHSVTPIIKIS